MCSSDLAQDRLVIVATLSMFEEVRAWARASSPRYLDVLIRVPEEIRRSRDRRGVFERAPVVGVDLPFEEPRDPEVLIDDDGSGTACEHAARIVRAIFARGDGALLPGGEP